MRPDARGTIAVLTYHRIADPIGQPGFYDVPLSRFDEHIEVLASVGQASGDGRVSVGGGREACLTFDDGTADHLMVAERLRLAGIDGVFFLIVSRLGRPGYLTAAQVREIAGMGHRIGSHTMTHRRLPDLPPVDRDAELLNSRLRLEDLAGRAVNWLALPGGFASKGCLEAASRAGYSVVRTMEWGYADAPLQGAVPCLPIRAVCDAPHLRRLLEGRASLWPYRVKSCVKGVLGKTLYTALRDRLGASRASGQPGVSS